MPLIVDILVIPADCSDILR